MKAIRHDKDDSPDEFKFEDIDKATPKPHEILIWHLDHTGLTVYERNDRDELGPFLTRSRRRVRWLYESSPTLVHLANRAD